MFLRISLAFLVCLGINNADTTTNPYCSLPCGNITHACCEFEHSNPGPKCKRPYTFHPMTSDDRSMVLKMHNVIRNVIASGMDPILPHPSSNMQMLIYDEELEFLASCWATQCRRKPHGCLTSIKGFTANHVWQEKERRTRKSTGKRLLTHAIYNFYKQADVLDEAFVMHFHSNLTKPLLFLSQILWANSQYMGCSKVTFGSGRRTIKTASVVCVYYPMGNRERQPVYEIGKPCSRCPNHMGCHVNYTSLCASLTRQRVQARFMSPFPIIKSLCSPEINLSYFTLIPIFLLSLRRLWSFDCNL